jgi:3-oxoacyl-[acyl-carrier-protein] synthase II
MTNNGKGPDQRRVVITGMGTVNPIGCSLDEFWSSLVEGRSGAGLIEGFSTERTPTKFACQVVGFNPQDHLDRRTVQRSSRFTHFALVSSNMAVADSGLHMADEDPFRCGVELGTGIGGFDDLSNESHSYLGGKRLPPLFITTVIPNIAAAQVALAHGFKGQNGTTTTACAASTHALGNAFRAIRYGHADVMLAVGTEGSLCEMAVQAFNSIKALSTRNDEPERASRPFDKDRDGFVMGEGGGTLVLEELERAKARGARIYAEVMGYGNTNDAYHQTALDETGTAPARAVGLALDEAGIEPEAVDYVNAHGTSTGINDAGETKVLKLALGEHARKVAISSTKSMIGHLFGGAGAVEAIATVLCITHATAHPTINYVTPDPECDLDYVPNQARPLDIRIAISNGFGFGGQNSVVVLSKYEE